MQIDVKFFAPIGAAPAGQGNSTSPAGGRREKCYQFAATDDCTRLRVLRIYDRLNRKTAIAFADYVLEKLPFRPKLTNIAVGRLWRNAAHLVPERGSLPERRAHARGHLPGSGGPDGLGPAGTPRARAAGLPAAGQAGKLRALEKFSLDAIAREQAKRAAAASSRGAAPRPYTAGTSTPCARRCLP